MVHTYINCLYHIHINLFIISFFQSALLSENANSIRDILPKDYVGEDGSMGAAAVSASLKDLERNGQSTFRKLVCYSCFFLSLST